MKKIITVLALLVFICTSCYHRPPEKVIYSTNNSRVGIVQDFKIFEQRSGKKQYYILIRDIGTGSLKEIEVGRNDWSSWWTGDTIVGYDIKIETD